MSPTTDPSVVAPPHDQALADRHRRLSIGLAVFGVFVTYVPITAVSVALTTVATETGASTSDLQWVTDAYVIPMAAAVLSAGVLGDRHGRRRIYLLGMALTTLGSAVAGLAGTASGTDSVHLLWAGQAVSGLGAGLLLPTTLALIGHAVPDPRERGRFIGLWATGMMLGLALGPILSGLILEATGWGWVFAPVSALSAMAGVLAALHLPESKAPHARHPDWWGQASATTAIAASIFGTISGGEHGWTAAPTLAGYAVAALALVAFLAVERVSRQPLMDLTLFRSPAFTAAGIAAMVALFSVVGAMFLLSLFLGYAMHLSALQIGLRLLFVMGVGAVANPVIGAVLHRLDAVRVLVVGLLVAAVAVLLLTGVDAETGFADLAWRLAVFGVSVAVTMTTVSTAAINAVPWQQAGMAAATNTALRQYGGALGPAVLGVVYADRVAGGASPAGAMHTALAVNAALLVLAALLCALAGALGRRGATPPAGSGR